MLVQELEPPLHIDEQRDGREALRRVVDIIGCLGVLREAKRRGFIASVQPQIEALIATGYRFAPSLVVSFLQDVEERDT